MDEKRDRSGAARPTLIAAVAGLGLLAVVVFAQPSAQGLPPLPPGPVEASAPAAAEQEWADDLDDPAGRHRLGLDVLLGEPDLGRLAAALSVVDDPGLTRALRDRLAEVCLDQYTEEVCDVLEARPEWGVEVARRVGDGTVAVGMTGEQVELAWGEPFSREEEVVGKLWCYDDECLSGVKMLDDRVIGLQAL